MTDGNFLFWHPVRWLFGASGSLKDRVVRGVIWLAVGDAAATVVSLLKLAILSRLLAPSDFGLMALAMVMLTSLENFSQTGFKDALIQKPGDIRPYLDTAWTVQTLRSAGLAFVIVVAAPLGALFFANPDATWIIRAIAIVALLRGLTSPAMAHVRKELNLQREVIWRLSGAVVGIAVAIPFALVYRSVWALVLSVIAAQAAETLTSYWIAPYHPRPRLEWARARELMQFGRWVFCSNIVGFFELYLDSLIVGKMLGVVALGFYQVAQRIAFLPLALRSDGVMFPAFSKLQEERYRRHAFLRTLALVSSVVVPMGCFLTIFAQPVVRIALGEGWISISPTVQILVWAGVAKALAAPATSLLMALDRPDLPVRTALLNVLVMATFLYPLGITLGIAGAAVAVTTAAVVSTVYEFVLMAWLVRLTGPELMAAAKVAGLASTPFLAAGLFVSSSDSPSLSFVAGLAIAGYLIILVPSLRVHLGTPPRLSAPRKP